MYGHKFSLFAERLKCENFGTTTHQKMYCKYCEKHICGSFALTHMKTFYITAIFLGDGMFSTPQNIPQNNSID